MRRKAGENNPPKSIMNEATSVFEDWRRKKSVCNSYFSVGRDWTWTVWGKCAHVYFEEDQKKAFFPHFALFIHTPMAERRTPVSRFYAIAFSIAVALPPTLSIAHTFISTKYLSTRFYYFKRLRLCWAKCVVIVVPMHRLLVCFSSSFFFSVLFSNIFLFCQWLKMDEMITNLFVILNRWTFSLFSFRFIHSRRQLLSQLFASYLGLRSIKNKYDKSKNNRHRETEKEKGDNIYESILAWLWCPNYTNR